MVDVELAVFGDDRRAERDARTLAWRELIGMAGRDDEGFADECESGMPVSPAITEGSHAPLGVAEKPLPQ